MILFGLGILTLIIILFTKRPDTLKENKTDDIPISYFSSLDFIEIDSSPVYNESNNNLGLAGKLILDCFTGICILRDFYYNADNDKIYYNKTNLDYSCSEQCSLNNNQDCDCSIERKQTKGTCSRKYDDNYEKGKYCYTYNVIYNWKGKKYNPLKKDVLSYYNNAKLKEEECPKGTIDCGIIDDNENKLCIKSSSNCPINYFSENKLNSDKIHNFVDIGNKTFYYTYDNNSTIKRKIIGGLVADTDLYLNKNNDEKELIDIDTISGFLADNNNLYKGVNLGFDPYKEENINEKGNSYLRIFYNNKVDLKDLRDKINNYNSHHKINEDAINPIRKYTKFIMIFGLISFISFIIFMFNLMCCGRFNYMRKFRVFLILFFVVFYNFSLIYICVNISKFNKLKSLDENADNFPRLINLILFILYLVFLVFLRFLLLFMSYLREKCSCNICSKKMEVNITRANEKIAENNQNPNDKNAQGGVISSLNINENK